MPADPNRVAALFASAVAMPAEARAAYLEQSCGEDAELRRRVEALLQAHADAGSFLVPLVGAQPVTVDEPMRERPGMRIGPYKLL